MVNVERMGITLRVINLFPEKHDQAYWACGTSRCFAGFAIDLFGPGNVNRVWGSGGSLFEEINPAVNPHRFGENVYYRTDKDKFIDSDSWEYRSREYGYVRADDKEYRWLDPRLEAMYLLDLNNDQADALFNASNTTQDVNNIAEGIVSGEEFDCGEDCSCSKHYSGCDCSYCTEPFYEYED